MALTVFLFKVSELEIVVKQKADFFADDPELATDPVIEEIPQFLCAKMTFRGISLWSNNVPINKGVANFVARGNKPKKFHFNLASILVPDDKLRIEFYVVTQKKNRKKLTAIYELMLEALLETQYVDLIDENLSDPNNYLMKSTVQLKLYYTSPDFEKEKAALGATGEDAEIIDWSSTFDDGGRHGGHRYRHVQSKHDKGFTKFRRKFVGRQDDADTDSHSDSDFDGNEAGGLAAGLSEEDKLKAQYSNLELLEKSLGRYEGDVYQMEEWQIMVHVIQGKDFSGLDINPYICIQIDDQKHYTGIHRCTNSPFFGEFFTFDFSLPATQMMEKVIYFKVHHEKRFISTFTHTKPIGIFKVDVATVYNEKEHVFERKWAQLVNPDAIQIPCGHLLLSIAVAERGMATKNILGELSDDDDEIKPTKAFIPSAMPRKLFPVQLKITFYTAAELPDMMTDFLANVSKKLFRNEWEPIDSYVEVQYNALKAATSHENGANPVWREAFYLIGQFPPLVRTLKISLKDHAALQQDRTIGSVLIDLFTISETNPACGFLPTFGPTWVFLYGSPREYTINKDQDGLGEGMGEGVCYKGRLLMEIECHPISGDHTSNKDIQKEKGVQLPELNKFPMKRTFMLFGCIYDVTMIDKTFGNSTICFELSIGPSGYLSQDDLIKRKPSSSITKPYPNIPINNNQKHIRLPIQLQKPLLFTKYIYYDYSYRMAISNRLKRAANYMFKLVREFEINMNSKASDEVLIGLYRQMEQHIYNLPCGCGEKKPDDQNLGVSGVVHPSLTELLNAPRFSSRLNALDEKRSKKILHNLESLKGWISTDIEFVEEKRYETVKQLQKIARALKQLAIDAQPSLPDVFLWMICDSKRVAYARIPAEDLLYSVCEGEKGLLNATVQTLFLRTPRTADKELKSSVNAKVQIYLWLGTEEQEPNIFKQLPKGFDMPALPLTIDQNFISYTGGSRFELRCYCCKARSLIASDETGLSDPFLSITAGHETQTTPILKESLCPQWNTTLVFQNLMHVGTKETAEDIIGNVVVECYDYDDAGDGPDLIGRFSTTAEFKKPVDENNPNSTILRWFEFKLGDKRAGELLAAFELVEIDPDTKDFDVEEELEEIPVTPTNFPDADFIMKMLKNKIYSIPKSIMPELRPYEVEVLFWGLRECRTIGIEPIQHAQVSIECAGARITRNIKDVQKNPNFDSTATDADKYKLLVWLPQDNNFWPHISISCVQIRVFGRKEVVGNLVVTDLQKYLDKPPAPVKTDEEGEEEGAEGAEGTEKKDKPESKPVPYDFNRIRQSVVDAYQAAVIDTDGIGARKKVRILDKPIAQQKSIAGSEKNLINENESDEETEQENNETEEEQVVKNLTDIDPTANIPRVLSQADKEKLLKMEKDANWWSKYYASKAKLKLSRKPKVEIDDRFLDSHEVYAEFFTDERNVVLKPHQALWNRAKKLFVSAKKKRETLANRLEDISKVKSEVDESLNHIEQERLKELSLLQSFKFFEDEVEHEPAYEGFNDCLDKFPLYKGKGTSRSDEIGNESRVYTKFKGKLRIRELTAENTSHKALKDIQNIPQMSVNPAAFTALFEKSAIPAAIPGTRANEQLFQFDFNRIHVTLKCRLYVVKAILFRAWDPSGKADPYLKILLNNEVIIDDVKSRIHNTLEPVFGKAYEFEVTIPRHSLMRIQIWDWDLANVNDKIAETSIDIENRWLSCHRATCGLPQRYDSAGYNAWRDTKRPETILKDLCQTSGLNVPVFTADFTSLAIGDIVFNCPSECILFAKTKRLDLSYRKAHHESPEDYIKQNTSLVALNGWAEKINPKGALMPEHVESRSLIDPNVPEVEQGRLEMWLDFFPMSRPPSSAPVDITPPKAIAYQLRFTIWNTSDVELDDENFVTGEKSSDIYVKAWILGENEDSQQTDVHYRSLTGEGNFNWRFIYDFSYVDIENRIVYEKKDSVFQIGTTVKKIPPRIVIRIYDADLISADDFLGECILDLTHLPIGAKSAGKCKADMITNRQFKSVNLFQTRRCAGWWPTISPIKPGEIRDKAAIGGKVEAEFSLLTAEDAEKNPVGKAREGPSALEPPNRPKTSFLWFTSPWKTLRYVLWRNFKWPIIIGLVILLLTVFLLLALWSLPGEIVRQVSNKIFKTSSSSG